MLPSIWIVLEPQVRRHFESLPPTIDGSPLLWRDLVPELDGDVVRLIHHPLGLVAVYALSTEGIETIWQRPHVITQSPPSPWDDRRIGPTLYRRLATRDLPREGQR